MSTHIAEEIQWVEKKLHLNELKPFEHNPRTISESQFNKLKESIQQDGYHARIKVTHDLCVVGGHQRLMALRELGYEEVHVLVPSRELSKEEFDRILVRDNHVNGLFDMDMLSGMFDLPDLHDLGLREVETLDSEENIAAPGRYMVKCPECSHTFPTKGNKYKEG